MNFKLKRKAGTPTEPFIDELYNVYENNNGNGYSFMVISDSGTPYYFDVKHGNVADGYYLEAEYWEVVEIKEDKKMDTFKVGETYLCKKEAGIFTLGKLYSVEEDPSALEPYIVSNGGTRWYKSTIEYIDVEFEKLEEEQTPDPAADVKPVFVEANITELLEAINNGEQDQYYIYNPKKGTMVSVAWETNLHQLIVHQILRKVAK